MELNYALCQTRRRAGRPFADPVPSGHSLPAHPVVNEGSSQHHSLVLNSRRMRAVITVGIFGLQIAVAGLAVIVAAQL